MEKVCVVGLGYIGLPTASLLATKGFRVHGVDVNEAVVSKLAKGEIHIHEPDLDILVKSAIHSGNLTVSLRPEPADVFIIAVPTPFKENRAPDLRFVEAAVQSIADFVQPGNLLILESTSPVGTTLKIADWLRRLRSDLQVGEGDNGGASNMVYVAHCPERVMPGHILKELIENDRIVGGIDAASTEAAAMFYHKFVSGQVIRTNARTAELVKLTENTFRDVNIAFANELSMICEALQIDVWEVIRLANQHPRVNILQPGPGVGGHCIAVDPWFIIDSAPEQSQLIRTAREVNLRKTKQVTETIVNRARSLKSPVIACLGLSFKANVDDIRESPAVEIVTEVASRVVDGKILVVEPHLAQLPSSLAKFGHVEKAELDEAVSRADLVVLLVNHEAFYNVKRSLLTQKLVIDTRGIWR